ncbi:MAG: pseudouridine-5'-phosphate glycosidase [Anaerolineales bacterium]
MKTDDLPSFFRLSSEVEQALDLGLPVVALESTVITHGLPYPENATLAQDMESQVRGTGCVPATIAVLDGLIYIGLDAFQLDRIATTQGLAKISARDFAGVVSRGGSGGTTVAGTLVAAQAAGIRVFATGGIGGVHRDPPMDVSADLTQLATTPMIVVCAGAKAILDLPATLEYLETHSIPVVGYQTGEFPAFYSRDSGLPVSVQAYSPEQVLIIASAHWALGMSSAVLVAVPPPEEVAIPRRDIQVAIDQALQEMRDIRLRGQQVTPFLLQRVNELTGGDSLRANLGLLRRNAQVAGQIASLFGP